MLHFSPEENDQLYLIEWVLAHDTDVTVGKVGNYRFSKGIYVYIGSARKNIAARIERHLKVDKKQRWHMDYLRPYVEPNNVITVPLHKGECAFKQFVEKQLSGKAVMKGFGSSDCKCDSHLLKIPYKIENIDEIKKEWLNV